MKTSPHNLNKPKCDLCPGVTFRSIIQGATSIDTHRIGFTAGENFKLKNIRCRPCRNDPRIKNIAQNKSFGE